MMKVLEKKDKGGKREKDYAKSNGLGKFLQRLDEGIRKCVSEEEKEAEEASLDKNKVCE